MDFGTWLIFPSLSKIRKPANLHSLIAHISRNHGWLSSVSHDLFVPMPREDRCGLVRKHCKTEVLVYVGAMCRCRNTSPGMTASAACPQPRAQSTAGLVNCTTTTQHMPAVSSGPSQTVNLSVCWWTHIRWYVRLVTLETSGSIRSHTLTPFFSCCNKLVRE
jgi:hypothetical protein